MLDFGEIQGDYSLKTNTFSIPIPVEDYHVCRQLTLGKTGDILAKTQAIGKPGSGEHDHKTFALLLEPSAPLLPASLTLQTRRRTARAAEGRKAPTSTTS